MGKDTDSIQSGTLIDYSLSLHGLPMRWQSRIEDWSPNSHFVDTQVKGPYALWHHTHKFEPVNGGTLMTDIVRFRLPLGWLGNFVGGPFVRRDIRQIFAYRHQVIFKLYGTKTNRVA